MTTTPEPEPSEREALAEKVERAHAEIARLCDGGRWRMTVPVDPKRDSDVILTDALDALSAARPAPVVSAEAVEDLAGALALMLYDAHPTYANTAGWRGGIGGAAITQGCSVIDPPPGAEWAQYDLLSEPLRRYMEAHQDFDLSAAKERVKQAALAALGITVTDTPAAEPEPEPEQCGYTFPLPWWAGEDQMDPCRCDLPKGHPPTGHKTGHECEHIREDTPAADDEGGQGR